MNFAETAAKVDPGTLFGYISLTVGSITGIVIAIIQNQNRNPTKQSLEKLEKARIELLELKEILETERKARADFESKWESLRASFRIIYNRYEIEWKDHPQMMSMLKDIKILFDL